MNTFEELITLLAQVNLQYGQVGLNALLDDGQALRADVTFSPGEAIVALKHTRLGEFVFLPDRTVWTAPGAAPIEDLGVDNRQALDALRGGLQPQLDWLTRAFRLLKHRDSRLDGPIAELQKMRNQLTGIIIPGVANLNTTIAARTLGPLCLPDIQGDVSLRNITIDVPSQSVAFTLQILRGSGTGSLVFDPAGCSAPTPSNVRATLTNPQISLTLEVVLRIAFPGGLTSAPAVLGADMRVVSAEFSASAAAGRFVIDDPADPLLLTASQGLTLKVANLTSRILSATNASPTLRTHGGPVELWVSQGRLTKKAISLGAGAGQVVPDPAGLAFGDLSASVSFDEIDLETSPAAQVPGAARGTFHLPVVQFRGDVTSPALTLTTELYPHLIIDRSTYSN